MRFFRRDALFTGGVEAVALNYLPIFALAYGGSNAAIGLLGAAIGLGAAAACIPGAWLSARWRYRKHFILLTRGVLANIFLLTLALGPLIVPSAVAVPLIVFAAGARSFSMMLSEGAWTSLAADVAPARLRGQYFSSRNLYLGVGALTGAGFVGLVLSVFGMELAWATVWSTMAGLGVASALTMSRVPESRLEASDATPANNREERSSLVRDRNFMVYMGTVVLWSLSVWGAVPFFGVHMVKNLSASSAWVAGLLVTGSVFGLLGQAFVGRIHDRRGSRWMVGASGIAIAALPTAWYFVDAPYQIIGINALGGILWAGYLLASFNFLLAVSPPGQQRYYAAAYNTVVFLTMFAGPLLGGLISGLWGIKALFLASGAGRLIASVGFLALVRESAIVQPSEELSRKEGGLAQVAAPGSTSAEATA
jgi:MFS family permease